MGIIGSLVAGAGSSIANGIIGSDAAKGAAGALEQGAQQAQSLELKNQNSANTAQQTALSNVTSAEQPYQSLGQTGSNALAGYIQNGFQAPTLQQAQQTPGYQFNLQQGTNAINENAAANGTLLSGNTGTALESYGQNLAQNAYQQTYNNALNAYQTNVGTAQTGANLGLTSTGQLANTNLGVAGNTANIDLTAAQQQATQLNNAAQAKAGGITGAANAITGAIGGVTGAAQGAMAASQGMPSWASDDSFDSSGLGY
jgi:hypothetical protein